MGAEETTHFTFKKKTWSSELLTHFIFHMARARSPDVESSAEGSVERTDGRMHAGLGGVGG